MKKEQGLELARNSLWSAIGSIGNSIGTLLCNIAVARILGPQGAGEWAYIIWLTATVGIFIGIGLPEALTRYVAELRGFNLVNEANKLTFAILKYSFILTIIGLFITIILLIYGNNYTIQILYISVFLFVSQRAANLARAYLSGEQRFKELAYWMIASTVTQILLIVITSQIWGVAGALCSFSLGIMVLGLPLVFVFKLKQNENIFQAYFYQRVKNYALITWLSTIISMLVWQRMEIAFLEHYYSSREVGIFNIGLTTALMVSQAPAYLSGALIPFFAKSFGQNDRHTISRTYFFAIKFIAALNFPICFIGAALSQPLTEFLYGSAFSDASIVSAVMLIAAAFAGTSTVQSALVQGMDRPWFISASGIIGAILIMIIGFGVIPVWGIIGTAVSKASIQVIMVLLGTWYINHFLKFTFPLLSIFKIIIASTIAALVAYISFIKISNLTGCLLGLFFGIIAFILSGKTLKIWNLDEKKNMLIYVELFLQKSTGQYKIVSRLIEVL